MTLLISETCDIEDCQCFDDEHKCCNIFWNINLHTEEKNGSTIG